MNSTYSLILSFMLTFLWSAEKFVVFEDSNRSPSEQQITKPSFRYVIIYNQVVDAVHDLDPSQTRPKQRFVDILMEEGAFKEENLRILYGKVSSRFPEPQLLSVSVVTSLRDTETPEEHEGPHMSEPEGSTPAQSKEKFSSDAAEALNGVGHPRAVFHPVWQDGNDPLSISIFEGNKSRRNCPTECFSGKGKTRWKAQELNPERNLGGTAELMNGGWVTFRWKPS